MKYIVDIHGDIEGDYEIIGKYTGRFACKEVDCTMWSKKTQMVDKSNFDMNQYKADLETAHDCGEAKWLKCIEDIKAEIEKQIERDHTYAMGENAVVKVHDGIANGLQVAIRIIDRHVKELRGEAE